MGLPLPEPCLQSRDQNDNEDSAKRGIDPIPRASRVLEQCLPGLPEVDQVIRETGYEVDWTPGLLVHTRIVVTTGSRHVPQFLFGSLAPPSFGATVHLGLPVHEDRSQVAPVAVPRIGRMRPGETTDASKGTRSGGRGEHCQ